MKKTTFILVLLTFVSFGYCQITFEKNFGQTQFDFGHSVKQTFDGGYIVTGSSDYNLMLSKTDANGDITWIREYGKAFGEEGYEVIQTDEGDYVFLSHTVWHDWNDPYEDIFLIKTNSIGDIIWTKNYGGVSPDFAKSFQITSDDGYIIVGTTSSFGNGGSDIYLIKTDSDGNTIWTKTIGTENNESGKFIQQTNDGGYIILAGNESEDYLIKTDNIGDTNWTRNYDISAHQVLQSSDSGFVIVGSKNSDLCLIKTDFTGNIIWTKTYYRPDIDFGKSISQTFDEGYIIVGSSDIPNIGSEYSNVYLVRTNSLGDTLWTRNFGGEYMDFGESVGQTQDNGFIIVGQTINFGASGFDVFLIKVNTQGLITGIEDKILELNKILIYPNPTKNTINIETSIVIDRIEIYNTSGEKVYDKPIQKFVTSIPLNISNWSQGVYFVVIQSNGKFVGNAKFVVE